MTSSLGEWWREWGAEGPASPLAMSRILWVHSMSLLFGLSPCAHCHPSLVSFSSLNPFPSFLLLLPRITAYPILNSSSVSGVTQSKFLFYPSVEREQVNEK